jgi:hypothetical protein
MLRVRRRRSHVLLAGLCGLAVLSLGACSDDGLREGSGEVDVDDASDDDTSTPAAGNSSEAPVGAALDRLACDAPLHWGQVQFDESGNPVGDAPPTGTYAEARAAADAGVLAEQPALIDYAEVVEKPQATFTQHDYMVSGETVAVITVVQRADGQWDFAEGVLCEAAAAIVPPELEAMRDAITAVPTLDLRTAKCVTDQGIAAFGADAWPTIAAGQGSDESTTQFNAIVEACRP